MNITIPEDKKKLIIKEVKALEERLTVVEQFKKKAETELNLLPQGDKVPQDAQDHKNELNRITKYIMDLQEKVKKECDAFSEDVKYWAEYRTGIKEFTPWLTTAEKSSNG